MEAECVVPCADGLGEGPLWSVGEQALYWVDVPRPSRLHRWVPGTNGLQTWMLPEMALAVAERKSGGLLIASARGLNAFDPKTGDWRRLIEPEPDLPANRINDAGTDRVGRFWFGTLKNNFAEDNSDIPIVENTGSLYSYDGKGTLRRHDTGIGASNTVAFSPDNRVLYFADTVAGNIYAYDFDMAAGAVSNRRVFAHSPEYGAPDGSTIDADGCLWSCRLGAGCIIRFRPDGTIDRIVKVPTRMVTSCTFGGANLDTLYVTTARFYLSEEDLAAQPGAGGLFRVTDTGTTGLPHTPFAG